MSTTIDQKAADNLRVLSAAMVEKAKSGHPGGPMGGADFIHILYSEFLNFDPDNAAYPFRDRFYLDPGHLSALLYSQLSLIGNYSMDELAAFRQWGSPTPGHPELDLDRGVENTSGPLGLGHAFGAGSAIAERFLAERFGNAIEHDTYVYISDGGIQEEISQGVGRIAGFLGLSNLVMFYDANDIQLSTTVSDVMSEDTAKKYEAWNWNVITINGNDHDDIRKALKAAKANSTQPTLIIGKTVMAKGAVTAEGNSYENTIDTHGQPLSKTSADINKTIETLGGNPESPFQIFDDVATHYEAVLNQKRKDIQVKKDAVAAWEKANPKKAAQLTAFLNNETLNGVDFSKVAQKDNVATRAGSAAVLSFLADEVPNMIVSSADLSNSDKTDAFLKKTKAFTYQNFEGAFLQAGVSELTMAALCVGMSLHGGVIPACATFFVFSDYMKPAIRVASLMKKQVIFIWTHDAFRVGEDGPTHQPIEQEAQIRLLEKLNNHDNKQSFVALRPADVHEATNAWEFALKNTSSPTGLILSRQNIVNLPENTYQKSQDLSKGGYTVINTENPDVILIANGSEVSTLVAANELLKGKGVSARIVSVPSEGLFRNQSKDYQNSVLPAGVKKFGLTAGLPVNLLGLVGADGVSVGLEHFGHSAPYTVLDEKFGFTPEAVTKQVLELLGK